MIVLDSRAEKALAGVKANLQRVARRAAELSTQDFTIVQGNRTQSEQDWLYAQGRSRPGKVVTWTRNSKHIGGGALDFAAKVNGQISWNEKLYPAIAAAFALASKELGIGIIWGGEWKTKDWGHIQLEPSRNRPAQNIDLPTPAVVDDEEPLLLTETVLPSTGGRPILNRGDKVHHVRDLQEILRKNGATIVIDGDFGIKTETWVKIFQKTHGLQPDGIVGPYTWKALGK